MDRIEAWHFVNDELCNGRAVPADGETLTHVGKIEVCRSGLHASRHLIDALNYAPGHTICRVECWGDVQEQSDKLVARNRMILWRVDGGKLLRRFAREKALTVAYLWDMPPVVRKFLETGDESIRAAARDAAWDATGAAAGVAARNAAWAAAWAARDAEWAAAWAARDAARDAAWAAAGDAARAVARDAAWDAARAAANSRLIDMVEAERNAS